jgi:hypothetical protein
MSVSFRSDKCITINELFDGRLEKFGIIGITGRLKNEHFYSNLGYLKDSKNNALTVYAEHRWVRSFANFHGSNGTYILTKIGEVFDTEIYSENQPKYWGSERYTHEAAMCEAEDEYYLEIMKHVRGEPSDIKEWANGMKEAEFAKELVSEDLHLVFLDFKKELMKAIHKEFHERGNPNFADESVPF